MVKMNFENPILEKMVRRWKWSRNNSLLLFETAREQKTLSYTPKGKNDKHEHHSILYQFQCMVTTTNTYYRRIINDKNQDFGILVVNEKVIPKEQIPEEQVFDQLELQMPLIENLLKPFSDKQFEANLKDVMTISDHEYLHQGQLIVLFREAGAKFPDRFSKAWALGNT